MIKNVIFDLGRVLINFDPKAYINTFNFSEKTNKQLFETIFLNKCWEEFDRGTLSVEDGIRIMINESPGLENEIRQVLTSDWLKILTLKGESANFFKKVKKDGFNVYILSNFSEHGFKYVRDKYDFFDYADGMVISYEVKMIKPESCIYDEILKRFNLNPKETVFIDDMEENVKAAREFGIKTILFTDIESTIKEFDALIRGVFCV